MSAQLDRLHRSKTETLLGERGKKDDHAVRFRDLKTILSDFEADLLRREAFAPGYSAFAVMQEPFTSNSFSMMSLDAPIDAEPLELADPAQQLTAWRAAASMPRSMFCIGLYRLGVLSAEEAIHAAKGNWPAAFGAINSVAEVMDPTEAEIFWAATTVIERSAPLFEVIRAQLQLTPEAADTLFGYLSTAE